MDAARSARRLVPQGDVAIVYRRTRAEMPADAGEVRDCLDEGIAIRPLLAPDRVVETDGVVRGLACRRMRLGEVDASGRPRPVPIEGSEEILAADTVIVAISQDTVLDILGDVEPKVTQWGRVVVDPVTHETSVPGLYAGGDAVRGPDSIIQAIADGRAAAEAIARRHGVEIVDEPTLDKAATVTDLMVKRSRQVRPQTVPTLPVRARGGFAAVEGTFDAEAAMAEAGRCLDCDDVCSLCVTVCPNRANLALAVQPFRMSLPILTADGGRLVERGSTTFAVDQAVQIVNIGDFCNDCGNCTTFCPTSGEPFKDKPRWWIDREGFDESTGDGFRLDRSTGVLRIVARMGGQPHQLECGDAVLTYRSSSVRATIDRATRRVLDVALASTLADGTPVDLTPCATLIALEELSRGSHLSSSLLSRSDPAAPTVPADR